MKRLHFTLITCFIVNILYGQENIAVNGTISSSTNITNPANAIDGNSSTSAVFNSSAMTGDLTIVLDNVYSLSSIDIEKGGAPQETYRFMVSETGVAGSYYDYGTQGVAYLNDINRDVRYIKIEFGKISGYTNNLYEINVYANDPPILFGYDNAGNRTSRTIKIYTTLKKGALGEAYIPEEFTDNLEELSFKMYPNPTKGLLTVEIENFTDETNASISIYDLQGRQIHSIKNATASNAIDLSNYSSGTYIMVLKTGDKRSEWKIVKE